MLLKCSRTLAFILILTSSIASGNSIDMADATGKQNVGIENPVRPELLNLWIAGAGNPISLKLFGIWRVASDPKYLGNSVSQRYLSVWDVTAVNPVNLRLLGVWAVPAVKPALASVKSNAAFGKLAHNDGVWVNPAKPGPLDPCSYGLCPDPIAVPRPLDPCTYGLCPDPIAVPGFLP